MITVFAKKRTSKNGTVFFKYLSKLSVKKGDRGDAIMVEVRFKGSVPDKFPVNIEIDRPTSNISPKRYIRKDGVEATCFTLWVGQWKPADVEYVDHSLDEVIL